jgi:hypothetical protein
LHIPVENILIPPSALIQDRKHSPDIYAPKATGRRAFGAGVPFPSNFKGETRLPRVLREATSFVLMDGVVQTEGIFRISPPLKARDIVRESYDRGQKFIIWKETNRVIWDLPEYPDTVGLKEVVTDIGQDEGYGVHVAAGLIKLWYSELRNPIVPESSYQIIREVFSGQTGPLPASKLGSMATEKDKAIRMEDLIDFLSPASEVSPLTPRTRMILCRHLFPLMYAVTQHSARNLMTVENLAIVFAPTLICGRNPMDDMLMTQVIRRVLIATIDNWISLREIFGILPDAFEEALKRPADWEDYEDPLDFSTEMHGYGSKSSMPVLPRLNTANKIVMKDYEGDYDDDAEEMDMDAHEEMQSVGVASPARSSSRHAPGSLQSSPILGGPHAPPLPPRMTSYGRASNSPSPDPGSGRKTLGGTPPLPMRAFTVSGSPTFGAMKLFGKGDVAPPRSDPYSGSKSSSPHSGSFPFKKGSQTPTSNPVFGLGMNPQLKIEPEPIILPPHYSTVVGEFNDSPTSYTADGFGPPRRSGFSFDESDFGTNEKQQSMLGAVTPVDGRDSPSPSTGTGMPKRKPVGSGAGGSTAPPSRDGSTTGGENGLLGLGVAGVGGKMDLD